jgi:hypothetical protein
VCALALLGAPAAALAQPRATTEFFGGYSFLLDSGNGVLAVTVGDDRFPLGWAAGVAQPLSRWLAVVAEAGGQYKTRTTFVDDVRLSYHSLLAGPRARAQIGPLTEFAQVLVGAAHGRAEAFGLTVTGTALSVQPGGGIDYALGSRLAARVELDYRWIRKSAQGRGHASQFRAMAALVVH